MTISNRTRLVLEPRGVRALLDKVRGDPGFAVTGSLAASGIAPVAPPALGVLYVRELGAAQRELKLRDAPTGANVMLVEPFSPWHSSGPGSARGSGTPRSPRSRPIF